MLATNPLLELCQPIIKLTAVFYTGDYGANLEDSYHNNLVTAVNNLEQCALGMQIPVNELQHMKYAIVAFIDEAVLNSAWPTRSNWMGNPLQLQHFGEHTAGEGFFKRLSELRLAGSQNINLLEIYYLCMQLGFQGMYRFQNSDKLISLQLDLHNQIIAASPPVATKLSPHGLPHQNIVDKVCRKLPFWIVTGSMGALLFCIYLGYNIVLNHQANLAVKKMTNSQSLFIQNSILGEKS